MWKNVAKKYGEKYVGMIVGTMVSMFANVAANAIYDIYIGPKLCNYLNKREEQSRRKIGF